MGLDWRGRVTAASRHSLPRFLLLSAVGFAFDLTLLTLLHRLTPLPNAAAVTLAFWATYALNFALNRHIAFGAHGRPMGPQLARFVPQVLGDYGLTLTAVLALQAIGLPLTVARVVAGGTNLVFNYVLYRWWTFLAARVPPRHPPSSPRRGKSLRDHFRQCPERLTAVADGVLLLV